MHDLGNFIVIITQELICHLSDGETLKLVNDFANRSLDKKEQVRTSDARRYLVRLGIYLTGLPAGKVDADVLQAILLLCEVTNTSYKEDSYRTVRNILRLYNTTFQIGVLLKRIVGSTPRSSGMTPRKFFGIYFHDIVNHFPQYYRVVCLRSLLAEKEERHFGALRSIAKNTSSRKPDNVIKTCLTKLGARDLQYEIHEGHCSFDMQDALISKEARNLPVAQNSVFSWEFIKSSPKLWQVHMERIADYILPGEVWWKATKAGIEFLDGPGCPNESSAGPYPRHYRQESLRSALMHVKLCWEQVVALVRNGSLNAPIITDHVHNACGDLLEKVSHDLGSAEISDHRARSIPMEINVPETLVDAAAELPAESATV